MGNNINVKLGEKAISDYNKTGSSVLNECQDVLKKANVPVPIVDDKNKKEKVAGLQVEHADEDVQPKDEDNKDTETTDKTSYSTKEGKFSGNTSTVNNTYTKFLSKDNKINASGTSSSKRSAVVMQNFMEAMDDIEAAGKSHIAALDDKLPESGNLSGGFTSSYQKNTGVNDYSFQADIKNSWQNKKKTFSVVASASVGYDDKKVYGDTYDVDLDYIDGDVDDKDKDDNSLESKSVKQVNKKSDDGEDDSDEIPADPSDEGGLNKFGSIAVNVRLEKENYIYGGGIVSTFSSEKTQVHDQFITIKHKTTGSLLDGVSADLTRRTVRSIDAETGEKQSRSQMKLTLDLVDRGKNEDFAPEDTTAADIQPEQEQADSPADEARAKAKEDAQTHKVKDGSGLDIDFRYDNAVCGAELQYGFNIKNDKKNKERLTVAPVGGAFNYSSPDGSSEALKVTLGVASEYKKRWRDGSSLNASLYAVANRVVESGSSPSDLCYVIANGEYNNPRKRLNVSVDAGIIHSEVSTAYIEAAATKKMKNFEVGLKAGLSKTKTGDNVDNSVQVLVTGKYNIPYKTKR